MSEFKTALAGLDPALVGVLEGLRASGERVRVFYGSKDNPCWLDEFDVIGYVGKSTGSDPCWLLVYNKRCIGGSPLAAHNIACVIGADRRVIYKKSWFEFPDLKIKNQNDSVFTVMQNDKIEVARFYNMRQAINWKGFMSGRRLTK